MIIKYYTKSAYGRPRQYPAKELAQAWFSVTGMYTITPQVKKGFESLGATFEEVLITKE